MLRRSGPFLFLAEALSRKLMAKTKDARSARSRDLEKVLARAIRELGCSEG